MDIKPEIGVNLKDADPGDVDYLMDLANRLNLPIFDGSAPGFNMALSVHNSRLELRNTREPKLTPLRVDFLSGPSYYRFIHDRRIDQPLAKAAGIKRGYRPLVLDATAGFGEDGFVLASLGCPVTMIERSPVIWALLENGISRSRENQKVFQVFSQRVSLHLGNSIEFLDSTDMTYDTVYLDPMYPASPKSPLNKKKMRLLRELVGDDSDSSALLAAALRRAAKRVVVKRPAKAKYLGALKPSLELTSKSSRYDIYLIPYL